MNRPFCISAVMFLLAGGGCGDSKTSDPASLFRRKHEVEAHEYSRLAPTDFETVLVIFGHNIDDTLTFAQEIKRRFGTFDGVSAYADKVIESETSKASELRGRLISLKKAIDAGGTLFSFEWSDGSRHETGLLILNNGEIVKREVFLAEEVVPG